MEVARRRSVGPRLDLSPGRDPGRPPAVEHADVAVPVVAQQPPRPAGGAALPVVVHDHRVLEPDPRALHRVDEALAGRQGVPAAVVDRVGGRVGELGLQVDVRRSGHVAGGVLLRAGRPTEAVADVEDGDVGEPVAELVGRDQRSVGHDTHPAPTRPDPAVTGSLLVAELHFFTGTMDSGKSTLALQTNHNHAARGRVGRIFTSHDRAGEAVLSSRLGLTHDALEVPTDFDFWQYVVSTLTAGGRIDYLICDEAQFYTTAQIDQLAKVVDELQIDVFAFGILTDFRSDLFPGSARLVELADRMNVLQVEALCWCGKRATHNARTENGVMVVEGEVVVVGDVDSVDEPPAEVAYEVLCRQHHRRRLTAARAKAVSLAPEPLPFG